MEVHLLKSILIMISRVEKREIKKENLYHPVKKNNFFKNGS